MPDGKEGQVPPSESLERPWASNDKVQFDNMISHCNRVSVIAEQSLQNAITFQKQANDAYLEREKQMADAYMEQANAQNKEAVGFVQELHKQYLENNRYTLDRLYSVFPEEATGLGVLVDLVVEALQRRGVVSGT